MNGAHYHLIVNHLPIVGVVIGILILIAGLWLKNREVKLTALGVFIFASLASIAAFYTGDGAEDVVENIAGISESLIHEHEELAESFLTLTLILGGIALLAFIAEIKKSKFAKYLIWLVFLIAVADGILAKYVGTSGGEIRHSEIRNDANAAPTEMRGDDDDDD